MSENENKPVETNTNPPTTEESTKKSSEGDSLKDIESLKKAQADLEKKLQSATADLEKYKSKEQEEIEKQKTSEQKLAEKEAELAKIKRDNLVFKLAAKKGLDADLFDRVKGDTEEEIDADIELLLGKFAPKKDKELEPDTKGGKAQSVKAKTSNTDVVPINSTNEDYMSWRSKKIGK